MASQNKGPSWAEQWGGGADNGGEVTKHRSGGGEKTSKAKAKAVATAGLDKAKTAAVVGAEKLKVGAEKVKAGTKLGLKWAKAQYAKRTSK